MAEGKTRAAAKHGTKKAFEASTLLALGGGLLVSNNVLSGQQLNALEDALRVDNYIGAAFVVLAVGVRYVPAVLRLFGWTRSADAFAEARSPDSPGGEDVTTGEFVEIGKAAYDDFSGSTLEERGAAGDQRGEGA